VCTSLNGIGFNESDVMYLKLIHSSIQDDPENYPDNVLINHNLAPEILLTNQFNIDPTLDYDNLYALLEGSPCINAGTADLDLDGVDDIIESFADWEVENYEIFHGIPDMGYLEFECPVERPELDACGNCYEFTDSEGYTSDSSGCDDDDDLLGDINGDGSIDVLDVVMLTGFILNDESPVNGDLNSDGSVDVLDIVMIVNIILGEDLARGEKTENAVIYYGNGYCKYEADGIIAGFQFAVNGMFKITENYLPSGWALDYNENTIILYSQDGSHLEDSRLFSYEGDLKIESSIFADWHGSSISAVEVLVPSKYALDNAYPNPFNPVTTIQYGLPVDAAVNIIVYDLQGRIAAELVSGMQTAGYYTLKWDASDHASGMYFVKMMTSEFTKTQKLMLVK
jgi:hypothetical protein